jgi:hypothetical protein
VKNDSSQFVREAGVRMLADARMVESVARAAAPAVSQPQSRQSP